MVCVSHNDNSKQYLGYTQMQGSTGFEEEEDERRREMEEAQNIETRRKRTCTCTLI